MNDITPDNQRPTTSDPARPEPTMTDQVGQRPTLSSVRREEHNLTTREALQLFEEAGLQRNQRSIERYCADGKLDAFFDSDEQRYYISRASAERLIGHLKEIKSRHEAVDVAGPARSDGIRPAATLPRQEPAAQPSGAEEHTDAYDKLRRAYRKLKFNYEVEKRYSSKIEEKFEKILTQVTEQSRQIGMLETELMQVQQLQARNPSNQTPVPRHVAEAEIIDATPQITRDDTPPTAAPATHATFADIREPHPEERV